MRILYLECNMGAAGDMLMGALADLLPEKEAFFAEINGIGIPGVEIACTQAVRCGITGNSVSVRIHGAEEESSDVCPENEPALAHGNEHGPASMHEEGYGNEEKPGHVHGETHGHVHAHGHHHAGLQDIFNIINALKVSEDVKEEVKKVYGSIAEAEGRVHGKEVGEIHFHEVGMADAIADITGCILLLRKLHVDKVVTSPVNVGFGQVRCAHGILPVPAPATALLLSGVPCYAGTVEGELCTPTGAALIRHITDDYRTMPPMQIKKIGYGMGKKDFAAANCVRAILGECEGEAEAVSELCCNLDDMTPEEVGYALEVFRNHGALDVYTTSIGMKKDRPGTLLTVMCRTGDRKRFAELIFKHTSTIGIREYTCNRMVLAREEKTVDTAYGKVRVKESSGFGIRKRKAEYEDVKKIADKTGMSLKEIKRQIEEE